MAVSRWNGVTFVTVLRVHGRVQLLGKTHRGRPKDFNEAAFEPKVSNIWTSTASGPGPEEEIYRSTTKSKELDDRVLRIFLVSIFVDPIGDCGDNLELRSDLGLLGFPISSMPKQDCPSRSIGLF